MTANNCRGIGSAERLVLFDLLCNRKERRAAARARFEGTIRPAFTCARNRIIEPAKFDHLFVHVVSDVGCFGIIIAGLAYAADVYEVVLFGFDFETRECASVYHAVPNKGHRNMSVAEKANRCGLIREVSRGGELIKHIS